LTEYDDMSRRQLHFLTVLFIGTSASAWAIFDIRIYVPSLWLLFLCVLVVVFNPREFLRFLRRFAQIGTTLLVVSALQIIFRRDGAVLLSVGTFPLVFSVGLREAILLWVRFMVIFALAYIFARVTTFHFLLFCDKIRLPLNFSLLLLTTLRLIPYIFSEAKRSLWFLRFRGIQFRRLALREKLRAVQQLAFSLLMRSIENISYSAIALEARGYGQTGVKRIPRKYSLTGIDLGLISLTALLNVASFMI